MTLDPRVQAAHDAAVRAGQAGYLDPLTGLFVMTSAHLRDRGHCCGNGCRHCPYEPRHGGSGARLPSPDRR